MKKIKIKKPKQKKPSKPTTTSEILLFFGDLILKYLGFLTDTFQLFVILHSLKWITKLLLIPLVLDQDPLLKIYPCGKNPGPSITEVVILRCQTHQQTEHGSLHRMIFIPSELRASDFVF